jgi:CRISPR-associated protein Csm2
MSNGHGNRHGNPSHRGTGFGKPSAGAFPPGGGRDGGHGPDDSDIVKALQGTGAIALWADEDRKNLRAELLDQDAQDWARKLRDVPSSQLRRFYGPVVAFKQRLQIDKNVTDGEVRAQTAYMKASAAYAGARKQPKELVEFFVEAANSVRTRDDFAAFARHFEAVVAFHKVYAPERKGE